MISSIICILKNASISWEAFLHIALPAMIIEFIIEEILINIFADKHSKEDDYAQESGRHFKIKAN